MKNKKLLYITKKTALIILLMILWESIYLAGVFSPLLFPSVESIFKAIYNSLLHGELLNETIYSLLIISKGLLIGIVLALILAALSSYSKFFDAFISSLISIAHPLPGIALLPLIILWLGTGESSVIFIIVHSVLWPLVVNLNSGFKSIPRIYIQLGENYQLNFIQIIGHILMPASLPYIISGLKIGWARSWRALISAEMIFGAINNKGGLGWFIFKKRVFMDTAGLYAGLIVIILIGILVEDLVFVKLEKNTLSRWGLSSNVIS